MQASRYPSPTIFSDLMLQYLNLYKGFKASGNVLVKACTCYLVRFFHVLQLQTTILMLHYQIYSQFTMKHMQNPCLKIGLLLIQLWSSFFGHKLRIQLQEKNQNTTNTCKQAQPKWRSRNNTHPWPNFPCDIEFVKNPLVGHVKGFFQVPETLFPLNPII